MILLLMIVMALRDCEELLKAPFLAHLRVFVKGYGHF